MYDFNFAPVFAAMDQLLIGAWVTVKLSAAAMAIGLVVSVLCAVAKTSGPRPVRLIVDAYIEVIRNTPFLVQIFFLYFGLPTIGHPARPEHRGAPRPRRQLRRLRHGDHPGRHRVDPQGPARGRHRPRPLARCRSFATS